MDGSASVLAAMIDSRTRGRCLKAITQPDPENLYLFRQ